MPRQRTLVLNLRPYTSLPTLWFRNTWSWGRDTRRPNLRIGRGGTAKVGIVEASHDPLGDYRLYAKVPMSFFLLRTKPIGECLWGVPNSTPFVKDSINDYVVYGDTKAVNSARIGTKAAAVYRVDVPPQESRTIRLRLKQITKSDKSLHAFANFDELFTKRAREADEFYAALSPTGLSKEHYEFQRQALAGMLWSKQFYHYIVEQWLEGDPASPPPPGTQTRAATLIGAIFTMNA